MSMDTAVVKDWANSYVEYFTAIKEDVVTELTLPPQQQLLEYVKIAQSFFYLPHVTALVKPGWITTYVKMFADPDQRAEGLQMLFEDFACGITVALTLVPQALSYATLAELPPVMGLYAAVVGPALYSLFGSSSALSVGPVTIVSLLVGSVVADLKINFAEDEWAAYDIAAESCFCVGIVLVGMSLLNCGQFMRFISHSVMSGFTTAAAMLIGLSQMKNAFGFTDTVPQVGADDSITANWQVMEWYRYHWNSRNPVTKKLHHPPMYRNPYALHIFLGVYIPLIAVYIVKRNITVTKERQKQIWYRIFNFVTNIGPLIAVIVAAHVAKNIKVHGRNDHTGTVYHDYFAKKLKIVGVVTPGINIARIPRFRYPIKEIMVKVLPITCIGFMESYSIARNVAHKKGELHNLSCGQEMFALGIANCIGGCLFSGYPIAGSYSRTSLNSASGGRTHLSNVITIFCIIAALCTLTGAFYWIPQAALSAIIFVAITNIITFSDFWVAWKHSKKDFFVIVTTWVFTLAFDTATGLAVGIGSAVAVYLVETAFSKRNEPYSHAISSDTIKSYTVQLDQRDVEALTAQEAGGYAAANIPREIVNINTHDKNTGNGKNKKTVEIIRLNNDLLFLTIQRIKDFISYNVLLEKQDILFALVLDFVDVKHIDLTSLLELKDIAGEAKEYEVYFIMVNVTQEVQVQMAKFGITNTLPDNNVLDEFLDNLKNLHDTPAKFAEILAGFSDYKTRIASSGLIKNISQVEIVEERIKQRGNSFEINNGNNRVVSTGNGDGVGIEISVLNNNKALSYQKVNSVDV